jgi:hypothetical protein
VAAVPVAKFVFIPGNNLPDYGGLQFVAMPAFRIRAFNYKNGLVLAEQLFPRMTFVTLKQNVGLVA